MNDMVWYDTAVIGGGVLGCFAARNLMRWDLSVALLEAQDDICKGITKANTAIVYTGYDNRPGSLKARLTVQGNQNFAQLCEELDVPFSRCGSLLVAFDSESEAILQKKYQAGVQNGVRGLQILTGEEVLALEPMLSQSVTAGLYAPDTGTVNPWQLGIAACENAVANGCMLMCNEPVLQIQQLDEGFLIETKNQKLYARTIINCAGLYADQIQNLLCASDISITLDGADYLVMNRDIAMPQHIIFQETKNGKGITAVPCTEGNLLLESKARPLTKPFATTEAGLISIQNAIVDCMPKIDYTKFIRSFGAVRPNLCGTNGENYADFYIGNPIPGFISLIGIKTPGLTCADELGRFVAEQTAVYLHAKPNTAFSPLRKAIVKTDGEIVCQCEQITRSEIVEAIKRGAKTVEGVKRRVGTGMGPCQGSRCTLAIERLLEEVGHETL